MKVSFKKFNKIKMRHWVIIISVIGIIILYFVSIQSKPKEISINEIKNYEGRYVIIEGIIIDEYTTNTKSKIYTIFEDNSTALILVEKSSKNIEIGDKIRVEGKVQKYQDLYEIVVLSDKSIEFLEHWDDRNITIQQLANSPQDYLNTNVNVSGYAIYVEFDGYNTTFYLTDNLTNGNNSLKVVCKSINATVPKIRDCDLVFVKGKFVFDDFSIRYFLEVKEKEHGVYLVK